MGEGNGGPGTRIKLTKR